MRSRINIFTVASIGIFAFGLEPVVHEVLGHGVACRLTGGKVILISSTAMQTASASRLVPAAGPIANIVFGLIALALFRALTTQHVDAEAPGATRLSLTPLFLYFFAFANLFLATGYILYSGLINFGDFAAVIEGIRPAWLYRAALVVIGALGYRYGIALAARCLASLPTRVRDASPAPPPISLVDARRLIHTACFAGGALFLLASCLNPISPSLILYDGVSGTIGLTLGFFLALTDLRQSQRAAQQSAAAQSSALHSPAAEIPFNLPLTIAAAVFAVAFLIFMGKGIRLP
jgi:hypothetical protein